MMAIRVFMQHHTPNSRRRIALKSPVKGVGLESLGKARTLGLQFVSFNFAAVGLLACIGI